MMNIMEAVDFSLKAHVLNMCRYLRVMRLSHCSRHPTHSSTLPSPKQITSLQALFPLSLSTGYRWTNRNEAVPTDTWICII